MTLTYVSREILKYFADNHRRTYELFIDKGIVSKKIIDKTMSQNYVYEHTRIEDNTIENIFAEYESRAVPLIDDLIKNWSMAIQMIRIYMNIWA